MKLLVKLGGIIATLLMFAPIVILSLYDKLNTMEFLLLFVCSILYDIYHYSVIKFINYLDEQVLLYNKVKDGKALNSKTTEEKTNWFSVIGISTIEQYLKNK